MDELYSKDTLLLVLSTMKSFNEHVLNIMLYSYDKESDELLNNINNRPFNAADLEHNACKPHVVLTLKAPARLSSEKPASTKPSCHPIKTSLTELKVDGRMLAVFDTTSEWNRLVQKGEIWCPLPFSLKHEQSRCVPYAVMRMRSKQPLQNAQYPTKPKRRKLNATRQSESNLDSEWV